MENRWTSRISPILEEPESPEPPTPQMPLTETLVETYAERCEICKRYDPWVITGTRKFLPQKCYPHFHRMHEELPHRQPLIMDLLKKNKEATFRTYININIIKDLTYSMPESQPKHPAEITEEMLNLFNFMASANSSTSPTPKHQVIGRTTNNGLYYPFLLNEPDNLFIPNFNKIRTIQEAFQFHPWHSYKPTWLEPFSASLHNSQWREFTMITFNSWLMVPALVDTTGHFYIDINILKHLASLCKISLPQELPGLLSIHYLEYISEREHRILENLYKEHFPRLWSQGNAIGPIIPLPTFARGVEIVECLLSPKFNLQLFTPITGIILLLKQPVPFIMIAGRVHIPYSIVRLIIPHPPLTESIPLVTQQPPKQLHNWLLLHLITAARLSKYSLNINPVIPISNIIQIKGIKMFWIGIRNKLTHSLLISKLRG